MVQSANLDPSLPLPLENNEDWTPFMKIAFFDEHDLATSKNSTTGDDYNGPTDVFYTEEPDDNDEISLKPYSQDDELVVQQLGERFSPRSCLSSRNSFSTLPRASGRTQRKRQVQFSRFIKVQYTFAGEEYDRTSQPTTRFSLKEYSEILKVRGEKKKSVRGKEKSKKEVAYRNILDSKVPW